ncbi:unnamed protein product [Ixodes pacificus]
MLKPWRVWHQERPSPTSLTFGDKSSLGEIPLERFVEWALLHSILPYDGLGPEGWQAEHNLRKACIRTARECARGEPIGRVQRALILRIWFPVGIARHFTSVKYRYMVFSLVNMSTVWRSRRACRQHRRKVVSP